MLIGFIAIILAASAIQSVTPYQLLEEDVKFYLYTREVSGLELTKDNICAVDPEADVKVLVHGRGPYTNSSSYWVGELTNIYLSLDKYNVIHVAWTKLAAELNPIPLIHATNVGYYIARLLRRLQNHLGITADRVHLIGHSFGAQLIGFAGKHVKTYSEQKVAMLTGLDRADEEYDDDPAENGLYREDATIVSVIHSDDLGAGKEGSVGTVDFYPNGGAAPQPPCVTQPGCDHDIGIYYFLESVENPIGFVATKCDSYENYLAGLCDGNDQVTLGGNLLGHDGDYYFLTNAQKPYSIENATVYA